MTFDGKTRISICYEDDFGKITIENYKLDEIVKYISAQSFADIQLDNNYKNKKTKYIIVDGKKYNLKTDISIEVEISLLCVPLVCNGYFTQKYNSKKVIQISEFYNYIAELVEYYAYELDTDINNIKLDVKELKILNVYERKDM